MTYSIRVGLDLHARRNLARARGDQHARALDLDHARAAYVARREALQLAQCRLLDVAPASRPEHPRALGALPRLPAGVAWHHGPGRPDTPATLPHPSHPQLAPPAPGHARPATNTARAPWTGAEHWATRDFGTFAPKKTTSGLTMSELHARHATIRKPSSSVSASSTSPSGFT